MTKNIEVIPYDPLWPKLFEIEAEAIKKTLIDNCMDIHHIGSTAVPGLIAKPKIDIILVAKSHKEAIKTLEQINFKYKGEYNIPLRWFFTKRGEVDINLHVYEADHPEIELNLLFRDYLRTNPKARDEYAALKQHILSDKSASEKDNFPFTNYTLRKGDFIRQILEKAGFIDSESRIYRLRMLKCNDETERAAARNFRTTYFSSPDNIEDPYIHTFNHPDHEHIILYQGTKIIGYVHLHLLPDERAAIRMIVIEESKRNNNFGSVFLDLCEKWLTNRNYNSIHAESTTQTLGFYRKNGYIEMPFQYLAGYECSPENIAVGKMLKNS